MADPVSFAITTAAQIGISYLFPSEGPRVKDMTMSASTYGAAIPYHFGLMRVAGNVIWSTPIRERKKKSFGGKGGFSMTYRYTCSFAMAFCQGPVTALRRIWADGKLIVDFTADSDIFSQPKYRFTIYRGDEDQVPNSLIEADLGEGNAPGFRGLCYIVFEDFPLDDFGGRLPQFTAEVYKDGGSDGVAPSIALTSVVERQYASGELIYDSQRGFAFKSCTNPSGIARYNTRTGKQDKFFPVEGITGFPTLMAVSQLTGNVFYSPLQAVNQTEIRVMNGNTGQDLATIGYIGSSSSRVPPYSYAPPGTNATAVSRTTSGEEHMLWRNLFGDSFVVPMRIAQFSTYAGTYDGYIGDIGSLSNDIALVGVPDVIVPTFYTVWGGYSNGTLESVITIRDLDDNILFSLPNPEGSPQNEYHIISAWWDSSDPGIVFTFRTSNFTWAAKWSQGTGELSWLRKIPSMLRTVFKAAGEILFGELGLFGWSAPTGARLFIIDTVTGLWKREGESARPITIQYPGDMSADQVLAGQALDDDSDYIGVQVATGTTYATVDRQIFDPYRRVIVGVSSTFDVNGSDVVSKSRTSTEDISLQLVVEDMLRYSGLTQNYFDMSRLGDVSIKGYGWARNTDVKSILEELQRVFLFDIVESGGRLIGVKRGIGPDVDNPGEAVATLPQNILGSTSYEANDFWVETRVQEADLPAQISFGYMNYDNDFLPGVATTARISNPIPAVLSRQKVDIALNVVMTATEAKNRAVQALHSQWKERSTHTTRLPWALLDLDPADLISVDMNDGRNYFERIHRLEIGADFSIDSTSYGQDSGAYTSNLQGDGGTGGWPSPVLEMPAQAKAFVLNTPLIRDIDDTNSAYSRYYTAVGSNSSTPFSGAAMYRSLDGLEFSFMYGEDDEPTWGTVSGTVPTPSRGYFALDWETQISIYPSSADFELTSITDDDLWAGGNPCLIGEELIQFRDAVENADGTWTIYNLLRGRRGTEYACDTHVPNETFIFLDDSAVTYQGEVLDARGQGREFRAVGEGASLTFAEPTSIIYEPRDLMPYAPKDIRRTIAGGTISVNWKRRTRMGGNMMDLTGSVPLNESSERYRIYFLSAPFDGDLSRGKAPEDYLATFDTTSPSVSWTPDPSVFDPILDSLNILVYQLSSTVGLGFPGTRTVEPWDDF